MAQTERNFEIIAVDDGTTDNSMVILNEFADQARQQGIQVRTFTQANAGPSSARNKAISESKSPYVLFFDADDRCEPDMVEKLLGAIEKAGEETYMVFPLVRVIDNNGARFGDLSWPRTKTFTLADLIVKNPVYTASGVLVRTETLRQIDGFDVTLRSCGDYDTWLRIAQLGDDRLKCVYEPLVDHRRHSSQITKNRKVMQSNWLKVIEKVAVNHPDTVARMKPLAYAHVLMFWSVLAYEAGAFGESRGLFLSAWRQKPIHLLRERLFWKRLLVNLLSFLPNGPRKAVERLYARRKQANESKTPIGLTAGDLSAE